MNHSATPSARHLVFKNNGPWIAGIVGILHVVPHYIVYAVWKTAAAHTNGGDRHVGGGPEPSAPFSGMAVRC